MSSNDQNLQALYPFLHGDRKDKAQENEALLSSVHSKAQHSLTTKQTFFAANAQQLVDAARTLAGVFQNGGRLFAMGNGGSSCDAAHFSVEFEHPVTAGRPSLPVMNLGTDTAMLTAVGNDVGMQHVFVRQIECHARVGDCLVGFSTSGNSDNLMAGFNKAKAMGLMTLGFAGGNGGAMAAGGLDHCLVVESPSIHRVQEVHVACYHIIWDLVHTLMSDQRGHLAQADSDGDMA